MVKINGEGSSKIVRIVSMVRVFIVDNYSACYN